MEIELTTYFLQNIISNIVRNTSAIIPMYVPSRSPLVQIYFARNIFQSFTVSFFVYPIWSKGGRPESRLAKADPMENNYRSSAADAVLCVSET